MTRTYKFFSSCISDTDLEIFSQKLFELCGPINFCWNRGCFLVDDITKKLLFRGGASGSPTLVVHLRIIPSIHLHSNHTLGSPTSSYPWFTYCDHHTCDSPTLSYLIIPLVHLHCKVRTAKVSVNFWTLDKSSFLKFENCCADRYFMNFSSCNNLSF